MKGVPVTLEAIDDTACFMNRMSCKTGTFLPLFLANTCKSFSEKVIFPFSRQKGGDLTQSYDKSPYPNRNVKGQSDNTNKATKKFE